MGEYLQLSPTELKFRFELRKNIPVTLSLHNPGSERVAFKVKTTSPKKYCVRPSSGYVEPGATKDVQVIMQAQREYPASLNDCKDKFLVQSLKIGNDVVEVVPELFEPAAGKDIKQSKLRVVLVGPPKPPSPVPEGIEEEPSPVKSAFKENGLGPESAQMASAPLTGGAAASDPNSELAKLTRERNRFRDQLAKAESENADLKKRLVMISTHDAKGTVQAQQTLLKDGHVTLLHLAFAALVAFFLGYFFAAASSK